MSQSVYRVNVRTDSQGALEDIILAALEHTEDGGYRYMTVEVPQRYVHDDLGTSDLAEQTEWATRFAAESGVEGTYDSGTWVFRRGDGFDGRDV
jgi:hypothetical protein